MKLAVTAERRGLFSALEKGKKSLIESSLLRDEASWSKIEAATRTQQLIKLKQIVCIFKQQQD